MSEKQDKMAEVILLPEYVALKEEVEKLRIELSMIVLERDDLLFSECKNIEMEYMLKLGDLEYRAYEAECRMLRLKRKKELLRMKKNRQEKVILGEIEDLLDLEFRQYQEKLDEQIRKMNRALERSRMDMLSEEETKELKKLYRSVVKALHPDLHPEHGEAQAELFQNAVISYENGDLNSLRLISAMIAEPDLSASPEGGMAILRKEKERLSELIREIGVKIDAIRNSYPYLLKEILKDPNRIRARREELEYYIFDCGLLSESYEFEIDEMLR